MSEEFVFTTLGRAIVRTQLGIRDAKLFVVDSGEFENFTITSFENTEDNEICIAAVDAKTGSGAMLKFIDRKLVQRSFFNDESSPFGQSIMYGTGLFRKSKLKAGETTSVNEIVATYRRINLTEEQKSAGGYYRSFVRNEGEFGVDLCLYRLREDARKSGSYEYVAMMASIGNGEPVVNFDSFVGCVLNEKMYRR